MTKAISVGLAVTALLLSACSDGADDPVAAGTPAVADRATAGSTGTEAAEVTVEDFLFSPTPIRIAVGTTVTWTNADSAEHSVLSKDKGVFGSESLAQGASFSYTPAAVGTVDYVCGIHNYMTGQIVVG